MSMLNHKRNSVFISYTHKDRSFVERLAEDLRSLGCEVWIDEWKVKVGDSILKEVGKAIKDARWMVIVLSPDALASEWVNTELRSGLARELHEKNIFVLPVLRKKVELPEFLRDRFYADFTKSYEQGLKVLRDRIVGNYFKPSSTSWLLVKNPLPHGLLSDLDFPDAILAMGRKGVRLLPALANNNLRKMLALSDQAEKSSLGFMRLFYADYLHEKMHLATTESRTETWFGNSGRLILRRAGRHVHGEYDWLGFSLVGQIEGEVRKDVILFDWSWTVTTEKGRGVFWTDVPNVLHGGWWSDFDNINEVEILSKTILPPNAWEFVKVPNLSIHENIGEIESHNKPIDNGKQ